MKVLSKYILPAALVAGFLFCFIQTAFFDHYPNPDDCVYDGMVRKFGIPETIKLLFKIDTGRWLSHIIVGISFYFLGHNFFLYGIYLSAIMLVFITSVAFIYKNYSQTMLRQHVPRNKQISFSIILTATLFFSLFEGRQQSFGWVSSAINHLLSVAMCLFLFGLLLKETTKKLHLLMVIMLSAFIGGSNEVNAICTILCIAVLYFFARKSRSLFSLNRTNMILSVLFIGASLLVNVSSGGYEGRMNGLPSFTLYQSIKNTVHSFLMPLLNYLYLPFFLGAFIVFILYFKQEPHHFTKKVILLFSLVFSVVLISFFLNCFLLSDVVPARAATWGYTVILLATGLYLVSRKKTG